MEFRLPHVSLSNVGSSLVFLAEAWKSTPRPDRRDIGDQISGFRSRWRWHVEDFDGDFWERMI